MEQKKNIGQEAVSPSRKKPKKTVKKASSLDIFPSLCKQITGYQCVKEYGFHPLRKWRADYFLPEIKLCIEVEGGIFTRGRHVRPNGFKGDMEKYNTMSIMGLGFIRVIPSKLKSKQTFDSIISYANNAARGK